MLSSVDHGNKCNFGNSSCVPSFDSVRVGLEVIKLCLS